MKKIIPLILLIATMSSFGQSIIVDFGQIEPINYKKFGNSLKVLSYVKSNTKLNNEYKFKLDGQDIDRMGGSDDSIVLWLPMIGNFNKLSIYKGDICISEKMLKAPISDDWGYFGKGMIHVLQSSHQDIAWMNSPEYCRNERIEDIIKPALANIDKDSRFTFEMEQSLNLMEFLDRYPERKDEIVKRCKEGKFTWGATLTQPYEGILTGEQLVREVYYGRKWIKDSLGCDETTAYNIDVPGRAMQVPQIFAKSGIKTLFISRMYDGFYDWYSPDGTRLKTFACSNYVFARDFLRYFEKDAFTAMRRIHTNVYLAGPGFADYSIPNQYAIVMSCDANKPIDLLPIIDEWNNIVDLSRKDIPHICLSTAEHYFKTIEKPGLTFQPVHGERPNLWLYIHGTAHHKMFADKRRAAIALPSAEIMSSVADQILNDSRPYPANSFYRAWLASIYPDHGLGGNKGNITDSVFADSLRVAREIGNKELNYAYSRFADKIKAQKGNIILFNDLLWNRNDIARYRCDKDFSIEGIPSQISKDGYGKQYICFIADVPAMGYNTFKVSNKPAEKTIPEGINQGENYYDGKFYNVVFGRGGIVSLYDKELKREIVKKGKYALGDILSTEYKGFGAGEFHQIARAEVTHCSLTSHQESVWNIKETGPVFTSFESFTDMKYTTVIQRITIYHTIKKIDVDIILKDFDGAHGRQFRILFPIDNDWRKSDINYEVPYAVAKVGRDEMDRIPNGFNGNGTYDNNPKDSHPREIQNFISASGNGFGFTLASDVNTADWIDPSGNREFYTVLQGILLSTHHSCNGRGEWYSQEGTHNYHFSILGHKLGWENGYKYALESNHPFTITAKENKGGTLPVKKSLMQISDPFVAISTLKKADDGNGYILRLVEMEGKDKKVTLTFPFEIKEIIKTNLIEENEGQVQGSGQTLTFDLGHNSVEAYRLICR